MKIFLPFILYIWATNTSMGQLASSLTPDGISAASPVENSRSDKPKSKPIMYNSLGYHFPINRTNDLMIGGSSIAYKHWGFCLTYRLGIANFMMPNGKRGEITYENVIENNWTITGETQRAAVFTIGGCLAKSITKKIPIYAGPAVTYQREFFQYIFPGGDKEWNVNPNHSNFQMNYCGGFFLPLIGRFLLNVEYNHNPQSVFVGIVIRDKLAYIDMDDW